MRRQPDQRRRFLMWFPIGVLERHSLERLARVLHFVIELGQQSLVHGHNNYFRLVSVVSSIEMRCVRCFVVLISALIPGRVSAQSDAVRATAADLSAIQESVRQLVLAANARDAEAVKAFTIPSFDARSEFLWMNRDGISPFSRRYDLSGAEIATLVRGGRLLTSDVALADGFFRTIGKPLGMDLAGSVAVTLVKQQGKWLVAASRFAPYRFSRSLFEVKPAAEHAAPGPDGWISLFDGNSMDAFSSPSGDPVSSVWGIEDGVLKLTPGKGDSNVGLRTKDTYKSFEFRFDWKLPAKGNSGLKYRLFYLSRGDAAGHEYQLADDAGDPGARQHPVERTASLYNQIAPSRSSVKPAGEWNSSVLIVRGRHCEHWLNGEKVLEYETDSGPLESPLLIQNHGTEAWFRNIRIRRLD